MKLLVEASAALPIVQIGVTFRAGRADEPEGREGLARVTAEMIRRGGDGRRAVEHALDRLGADLSEQVGLGATTLSCEVLTRSADAAVRLMAELLGSPCSDAEELSRVVRQSQAAFVRGRDDDALLCSRALRRHLFEGHPHGQRVLGTPTGLDAIESRDVMAFARDHYTQANAIVHIWGDTTPARAEALARVLFEGLAPGVSVPYPAAEPTPPSGRRLVIVDKADRSQTQLAVGTLGARLDDDDYHALTVANAAFGGTFTSRLTKEIRSERGWSYGASSQLTTGRVREAFSMWTAPGAEDAADCLALQLELLETWCSQGITTGELEQCRKYIVRSHAFEIDTPAKRLQLQLEREILGLPESFYSDYLERIAAVSRDDANAAIRSRISPRDLWVACVGDAASLRDSMSASAVAEQTLVELPDIP